MPRPDPIGKNLRKWLTRPGRRPKRGKDLDEGGVPVEPNRPNKLSGGAAAPLEFDDDRN